MWPGRSTGRGGSDPGRASPSLSALPGVPSIWLRRGSTCRFRGASSTLLRRGPWLLELQAVECLRQPHADLGLGALPGLLCAPRRPKAAKAPLRQPPAVDLPAEPGGERRGGRERVLVASPECPPSGLGGASRAAPLPATS